MRSAKYLLVLRASGDALDPAQLLQRADLDRHAYERERPKVLPAEGREERLHHGL
jgi:hypothetical protein